MRDILFSGGSSAEWDSDFVPVHDAVRLLEKKRESPAARRDLKLYLPIKTALLVTVAAIAPTGCWSSSDDHASEPATRSVDVIPVEEFAQVDRRIALPATAPEPAHSEPVQAVNPKRGAKAARTDDALHYAVNKNAVVIYRPDRRRPARNADEIDGGEPDGDGVRVRSAKLVPSKPEVVGGLTPDEVGRIIRRHSNEAKYCYEKALAKDDHLAGTVRVHFQVDAQGNVASAGLQDSSLHDSNVEGCVMANIERWKFANPRDNAAADVDYSFVFQTGEDP